MENIKRCKYCDTEVDPLNVRCDDCNEAWDDGRKHGEQKIRGAIRECFINLRNIAGEDK